MPRQRRLGKGIDALLQGRDITQLEHASTSVLTVPLDQLHPNPDQPRKTFDEESLAELARSIEERGIIQPILAEEREDGGYTIIAGERRWRAARMAGLTIVPVLPGLFSPEEKLEIALIENIQRQDLSPLEEARAYQELLETVGLSQEELARRLGRSRPAIANSLRLLKLPQAVQDQVNRRELTAGHARTLLALAESATATMEEVARMSVEEDLSVRTLEQLVTVLNRGITLEDARGYLHGAGPAGSGPGNAGDPAGDRAARPGTPAGTPAGTAAPATRKTPEMEHIEQRMIEALGTRVLLTGTDNRGRIEITYHSMDDLERIAELIIGEETFSS